jgi:hypothetical protein
MNMELLDIIAAGVIIFLAGMSRELGLLARNAGIMSAPIPALDKNPSSPKIGPIPALDKNPSSPKSAPIPALVDNSSLSKHSFSVVVNLFFMAEAF